MHGGMADADSEDEMPARKGKSMLKESKIFHLSLLPPPPPPPAQSPRGGNRKGKNKKNKKAKKNKGNKGLRKSKDLSSPFFKIPRTSFECKRRAPGYYADMEAECKVRNRRNSLLT